MSNQSPEQIAKTLVGHLVEAGFISASNDLSDAHLEREQERLERDAYDLILPVIREARSEGAQVEREAIKRIAKKELLGLDCAHERVVTRIVRAIDVRDIQSVAQAEEETK